MLQVGDCHRYIYIHIYTKNDYWSFYINRVISPSFMRFPSNSTEKSCAISAKASRATEYKINRPFFFFFFFKNEFSVNFAPILLNIVYFMSHTLMDVLCQSGVIWIKTLFLSIDNQTYIQHSANFNKITHTHTHIYIQYIHTYIHARTRYEYCKNDNMLEIVYFVRNRKHCYWFFQ